MPNAAPSGADRTIAIDEDEDYGFSDSDFGFLDADVGDGFVSLRITTLPALGVLQFGANAVVAGDVIPVAEIGDLVFVPPLDANGPAYTSFTFQVSDGIDEDPVPRTITFDVAPINDAPEVTVPGAQILAEDGLRTFSAANGNALGISDVEGGVLTVSLSVLHGTLTLADITGLTFDTGDGANDAAMTFSGAAAAIGTALAAGLTYRPAGNYNGSDTLSFAASDEGSLNDAAAIAMTITAVNDPPAVGAAIGHQSSLEDAVWTFQVPAGAFVDPDSALGYSAKLANGDPLPSWLAFTPATRTFSGVKRDFFGDLDIIVTASDGNATASQQFMLTVIAVNDAPFVSDQIPDQTVAEDTAWTFQVPAETFTDVDDAALTYSATLPGGGALPGWAQFNPVTRTFSGTPPLNFFGAFDFKVTASDGDLSDSDTFRLVVSPVNDTPVLVTALPDQISAEEAAWTFHVPAGTFTDVETATLSYSASLANGGALPQWLLFNAATQTFTGQPDDFNGTIDIKVAASDGALAASDSFSLTITPVNDAPFVANPLIERSSEEDTPFTYQFPANSFGDVDDAVLTYTASLENGAALPEWLVFDAATRTFSGTPPANLNGVFAIRVTASDGELSVSDSFLHFIAPVNDPPVLAHPIDDQLSPEDTAWNFQFPADTFTDVDNVLSYTATLASGDPLPAWISFNSSTRSFAGTPPLNFAGNFDIKLTASDGPASISDSFRLNIISRGDPPVLANAIPDQISSEDAFWLYQLPVGTFTDVDSAALVYTATLADGEDLPGWVVFTSSTRTFAALPPSNFNGAITLKVTASDGTGFASDEFALTITPVNDAPVLAHPIADQAVNEDTLWTFTVPADAFVDVEGETITYAARLASGAALPSWLAFDAVTRSFAGMPPANYHGNIDIKVTASDALAATSDSFRLTVVSVNDLPVVPPTGHLTVAEDSGVSAQVTVGATDVETSVLAYSLKPDHAPLLGNVAFASDSFTYTPLANLNGTDHFTIVVTDTDGGAAEQEVTVIVTPVDDRPELVDFFGDQEIDEDTAWSFQIPAGTFVDIDGDPLVYSAIQVGNLPLPQWISFDPQTRTFSGTPPVNFNGSHSLRVLASDGQHSATEVFRIIVRPVNDLPVLTQAPQHISTLTDRGATFTVAAQDLESAVLTYTAAGAAQGTVSGGDSGVFTYRPAAGFTGSDSFTVTVADEDGGTVTQAVTVDVGSLAAPLWRLFAASGFGGDVGGNGAVFGTAGFQQVTVLDTPGTVTLDPSFNRGGDVIALAGEAARWTVARSGSTAIFNDGDTLVFVPLSAIGIHVAFGDGLRFLQVDANSGTLLGDQGVTDVFTQVGAAAEAVPPLGEVDPNALARLYLSAGAQAAVGGHVEVFGTIAAETVMISGGQIGFDPSFNRGGDRLVFADAAHAFTAMRSGSSVLLTGAEAELTIPVGAAGLTLAFADGDRTLVYDAGLASIVIGSQMIGIDAVILSDFA